MERYSLPFIEKSEKWIEDSKKLEKTLRTVSGVLIGLGVGGWVSLGMDPRIALELGLMGAGAGLSGAKVVIERRHFEQTGR